MLSPETLPGIQRALSDAQLDGWLLFDFRGINPIASSMINLQGMVTRRVFAWVPRDGNPIGLSHAIEQGNWSRWPKAWERKVYGSWRSLDAHLHSMVDGRTVAMEYSPGDAVPYLDRVPAGVLELVRTAGATVVSSAELVSRFYAVWTPDQVASHLRAAEIVAAIGRSAIERAGAAARENAPLREHELQQWILGEFTAAGLETEKPPIVAIDANAANPHYGTPSSDSPAITPGSVLLVDLWARERRGIYADQTWMGSLGQPSARASAVWSAIRDARDAAVTLLTERLSTGSTVSGGEADDAARAVIVSRGFGEYFTHRTGHSIDARDIHGSGPHLDNLETRDDRNLVQGVGFSIEPGIYLEGEIGMRTEVNAYVGEHGLVVTPREPQRELMIV